MTDIVTIYRNKSLYRVYVKKETQLLARSNKLLDDLVMLYTCNELMFREDKGMYITRNSMNNACDVYDYEVQYA